MMEHKLLMMEHKLLMMEHKLLMMEHSVAVMIKAIIQMMMRYLVMRTKTTLKIIATITLRSLMMRSEIITNLTMIIIEGTSVMLMRAGTI